MKKRWKLEDELNGPGWGEGDALINLAAGHHDPQTPMQWCVAVADRVSSGWDRGRFEDDYNSKVGWKNYQKTRLLPLFESLCRVYTSCVPSARAGSVIPDISLYDHLKATSALAVAVYEYHRRTGSLTVENVKNYDDEKFLIINGDFHGIQTFIFSGFADSGKYRSKILRGRSFAVSLFSELAADMLTRELGLPFSSILANTAGKFTVVAPNTPEAAESVKNVERRINDWLVRHAYGEISIGISTVKASCDDFTSGRFIDLWERIVKSAALRKFSKFDLERYGGAVENYLDSFKTNLQHALCPICGKRPSAVEAENSIHVKETMSSCGLCRDHVFLGANLVKNSRISIYTADAEGFHPDDRLLVPIFDAYQLVFEKRAAKGSAENGKLLKSWRLDIDDSNDSGPLTTLKLLSGYVPKYGKEDLNDLRVVDEKIGGEDRERILEQIERGDPKTMNHIARMALNGAVPGKSGAGTEALGVLKADVDDLGLLMACGFSPERFTLTRMATLSRQLDSFFSVHLPHLLKTNPEFQNVYTVFAGGDDLFLIGPWNRIIDLSMRLRESFSRYVCENEKVHFSAGITVHKPHTPIEAMAESTEKALEISKSAGRDRLTLFSQTIPWDGCPELEKIRGCLEE